MKIQKSAYVDSRLQRDFPRIHYTLERSLVAFYSQMNSTADIVRKLRARSTTSRHDACEVPASQWYRNFRQAVS